GEHGPRQDAACGDPRLHPLAPVLSTSAECNKSEARPGARFLPWPLDLARPSPVSRIAILCNRRITVKTFRKELWFEVPTRRGFVNITGQVTDCLRESGVREGLVLVNAMHITASIFINDDESGLHKDYDKWLEALA